MAEVCSPVLEMIDLTLGYNGTLALNGVNAAIPEGAQVAVVGPNGAGKSTLFKALAGLIPAYAGEVRICGQPVGRQSKRLAYVPQREEIDWRFPVTVLDVVLMGRYGKLGWLRRPGAEDRAFSMRCLEQLGIGDLARRPIGELSGGQQQRVFLARALAQEPDILLLDEPFAGVDAPTKEATLGLLADLHARAITLLISTHDLALAASRFDHLMLLNHRLVAFGPPLAVLTPSALSATFGDQVFVYQEGGRILAVTDYCSPSRKGRTAIGGQRGT